MSKMTYMAKHPCCLTFLPSPGRLPQSGSDLFSPPLELSLGYRQENGPSGCW